MATPLEEAPASLAGGRRLLLKREDLHELGAFKWRGALPALRRYRERGANAVVTASTGNHGAATGRRQKPAPAPSPRTGDCRSSRTAPSPRSSTATARSLASWSSRWASR